MDPEKDEVKDAKLLVTRLSDVEPKIERGEARCGGAYGDPAMQRAQEQPGQTVVGYAIWHPTQGFEVTGAEGVEACSHSRVDLTAIRVYRDESVARIRRFGIGWENDARIFPVEITVPEGDAS